MLDDYSRKRLDRLAVDMAVTRSTVEGIEKRLITIGGRFGNHENRLKKLERRVFALWVLGPVLVGAVTFLKNLAAR